MDLCARNIQLWHEAQSISGEQLNTTHLNSPDFCGVRQAKVHLFRSCHAWVSPFCIPPYSTGTMHCPTDIPRKGFLAWHALEQNGQTLLRAAQALLGQRFGEILRRFCFSGACRYKKRQMLPTAPTIHGVAAQIPQL